MTLLTVSHHKQKQPSDCLAACAAMALQYLAVPIKYNRLLKLLGITQYGGIFSHLTRLESLGVTVSIGEGELETVSHFLASNLPLLVSVQTSWLDYWSIDTYHVAVVVGINIEEEMVYVNDPYFDTAPIAVSLNSFLPAWIEQKNLYAVISL